MADWAPGYTQAQLDDAQARYGLAFPPDLLDLLRDRRFARGYDWLIENPKIREMLEWPFDCLAFDVENGFWWPDWGPRPAMQGEREEVIRAALARAPRLIPLIVHRFIPETPNEAGNPVFSMYGFDTIFYGADLANFILHEFDDAPLKHPTKRIPFWSGFVEGFDKAYDHYAAFVDAKAAQG